MLLNKQRISVLKAWVFIAASIPFIRLVYLAYYEQLGAHPIEFVERYSGTWALNMLLITLAITPIKLLLDYAWPIILRRMLGLWMFFYACLHLSAYIWLDYWFDWQEIAKDLIKHPFIWVGVVAFLLTMPLAITSNAYMVNKLKKGWKKLHQTVYFIALLAIVHFFLAVKKDISIPLIYAAVLALLLGVRLVVNQNKKAKINVRNLSNF